MIVVVNLEGDEELVRRVRDNLKATCGRVVAIWRLRPQELLT